MGPLWRVLPRRRYMKGTRPGVTGTGPAGAVSGDQDQWEFRNGELTTLEKRLSVAKVMHTAVITLFQTHSYTFGGKFYLQKKVGHIGLWSMCCIARIVMTWWDKEFLELCAKSNLNLEDRQRYMDDIRVWMAAIRLGWRWEDNALVFKMAWRLEERTAGMSGLEKTIQVMKGITRPCTLSTPSSWPAAR